MQQAGYIDMNNGDIKVKRNKEAYTKVKFMKNLF
jgi:hypothetical protein